MRTYGIVMVAAVVMAMPAAAQWFKVPTPGIPRTPDGKPNLSAPAPHFDGDALVVETAGLSDVSWLDDPGHPHIDALRVIERFRPKDFGNMEIQITIDDPKAYTKPWTVTENFDFLPDTELLENICENEKDAAHLVGK
jgi:hypothetical protein